MTGHFSMSDKNISTVNSLFFFWFVLFLVLAAYMCGFWLPEYVCCCCCFVRIFFGWMDGRSAWFFVMTRIRDFVFAFSILRAECVVAGCLLVPFSVCILLRRLHGCLAGCLAGYTW